MNNNLIPTHVVDKNGKRTIVHKKSALTRPATNIPPVVPVVQSNQSPLDFIIDRMPTNNEYLFVELRRISNSSYCNVLDSAQDLMTTGSQHTRDQVTSALIDKLNVISTAPDPQHWYETIESRLVATWHAYEMSENLGIPVSETMTSRRIESYNLVIAYPDYAKTDSYWQSLALMSHAEMTLDAVRDGVDKLHEFIQLVEDESNPKMIFGLVSERKTIAIQTLSELIEQQRNMNDVIHNGIL